MPLRLAAHSHQEVHSHAAFRRTGLFESAYFVCAGAKESSASPQPDSNLKWVSGMRTNHRTYEADTDNTLGRIRKMNQQGKI
jgi:hypothetical protein